MAGRNDVIDGVPGRFIEPTVMPAVAAISGNASSHLPMELLECRIMRVGYADNIGEPDCFVRLSNVIAARLRFGERKRLSKRERRAEKGTNLPRFVVSVKSAISGPGRAPKTSMPDLLPKIERIRTPLPDGAGILRHAFGHNLVNGLCAFLFAATGPGAMTLAIGTAANLPPSQIAVWLFAAYAFSGVLTVFVCYLYRQPLAFGYSMPALVIVGPALLHLSLAEMVGVYLVTGALILLLAITGFIRWATRALPEPIVMAMVGGVFLPYGLRMIEAFGSGMWIAGAMIAGYLISSASPGLHRRFPPLLSALVAGTAVVIASGQFSPDGEIGLQIIAPVLIDPVFNVSAIIEFVIPLTVTVVGIHNTQGFAILRNAGYRPPENLSTLLCGGGTVVYGVMGSVPTVVTGPANAILNISGDPDWRFVGGIWFGLFFILFGLFAPSALQVGLALPVAFIATLAGLAMIPVLQSAFVAGFGGRFSLSALVTFLTTVAGVSIYGIGAAFWGLVFGYAVARIVERRDFDEPGRQE